MPVVLLVAVVADNNKKRKFDRVEPGENVKVVVSCTSSNKSDESNVGDAEEERDLVDEANKGLVVADDVQLCQTAILDHIVEAKHRSVGVENGV